MNLRVGSHNLRETAVTEITPQESRQFWAAKTNAEDNYAFSTGTSADRKVELISD